MVAMAVRPMETPGWTHADGVDEPGGVVLLERSGHERTLPRMRKITRKTIDRCWPSVPPTSFLPCCFSGAGNDAIPAKRRRDGNTAAPRATVTASPGEVVSLEDGHEVAAFNGREGNRMDERDRSLLVCGWFAATYGKHGNMSINHEPAKANARWYASNTRLGPAMQSAAWSFGGLRRPGRRQHRGHRLVHPLGTGRDP